MVTCFLFASINEKHDRSAYAFCIGNLGIHTESRFEWTMQEAYLYGLRDMMDLVIKEDLCRNIRAFNVCTPSSYVVKILTTKYLEELNACGWKKPDGSMLFHRQVLKELYYHQLYFSERNIGWDASGEVDETMMFRVDNCRSTLKSLLNPS